MLGHCGVGVIILIRLNLSVWFHTEPNKDSEEEDWKLGEVFHLRVGLKETVHVVHDVGLESWVELATCDGCCSVNSGRCITAELGRNWAKILVRVQEHEVHGCKRDDDPALYRKPQTQSKETFSRVSAGVTQPSPHGAEISGTPQGNHHRKHPTRLMSQKAQSAAPSANLAAFLTHFIQVAPTSPGFLPIS